MQILTAISTGMPRKIGFTVVNSSSHEENFSASELMLHAPTVSGWRSSRYIESTSPFYLKTLGIH